MNADKTKRVVFVLSAFIGVDLRPVVLALAYEAGLLLLLVSDGFLSLQQTGSAMLA